MQHPSQPFMQALISAQTGEFKDMSAIICDGPGGENQPRFLSTRLGKGLKTIAWSEATRWLIHAHAYDPLGTKTGAIGDPRVKSGKGYGGGTGWCGQMGGLSLVGKSVKETLLLNFVAPAAVSIESGLADLPVWERSPLTSMPEGWTSLQETYRQPTGPVDLYTWPSRRICIVGDQHQASGVINAYGDRATPENRHILEPMTAWRLVDRDGAPVWVPTTHRRSRALWRGLESLLPHLDARPKAKSSALAEWAAILREAGLLEAGLLSFRAVGVEYGGTATSRKYEELVKDDMTLPSALVADPDGLLAAAAMDAVSCAEDAVYSLGDFTKWVYIAAGCDPRGKELERPASEARAEAFARLDSAFRSWVVSLDGVEDVVTLRREWQIGVNSIILSVAAEALIGSGRAALVGRVVKEGSSSVHLDAGLAERRLRARLRKALPHAYEQQTKDEVSQ
jgi:CRISPR system Cascade subunit CasA